MLVATDSISVALVSILVSPAFSLQPSWPKAFGELERCFFDGERNRCGPPTAMHNDDHSFRYPWLHVVQPVDGEQVLPLWLVILLNARPVSQVHCTELDVVVDVQVDEPGRPPCFHHDVLTRTRGVFRLQAIAVHERRESAVVCCCARVGQACPSAV